MEKRTVKTRILQYLFQRTDSFPTIDLTAIELFGAIDATPRLVAGTLAELNQQSRIVLSRAPFPDVFRESALDHIFPVLSSKVDVSPEAQEKIGGDLRRMGHDMNDAPRTLIRPDTHYYFKLVETQSELKGPFAFVIMPFSEAEFPQSIFDDIILPTVRSEMDIHCCKVDNDKFKNYIVSKIFSHILKSECVIAELSTENPNVVFELGLAMAFEKPIIPIYYNKKAPAQTKRKLSFDYAQFDTIFYDTYDELEQKLRESLSAIKQRSQSRS